MFKKTQTQAPVREDLAIALDNMITKAPRRHKDAIAAIPQHLSEKETVKMIVWGTYRASNPALLILTDLRILVVWEKGSVNAKLEDVTQVMANAFLQAGHVKIEGNGVKIKVTNVPDLQEFASEVNKVLL